VGRPNAGHARAGDERGVQQDGGTVAAGANARLYVRTSSSGLPVPRLTPLRLVRRPTAK
jgi:hypothetical protein